MQVSDKELDALIEHYNSAEYRATSGGAWRTHAALVEMRDTRANRRMPGVVVLSLCESTRLVLRTGQLYRFEVMPGCELCERDAAATKGATDAG